MAAENISGLSLSTGIEYSWTVQQLGESSEVPDDRYFYDFGTKLVYYKDANGAIISIFDQNRVHYSEISATLDARNSWLVKRTVVTGLSATFEIIVNTDGQVDFTIADVIPLDFLSNKYFKINRFTTILHDVSKWDTQRRRTGTFSTASGASGAKATITGVGTDFLTEFKVGDRIGDGTNKIGYIYSITSATIMNLETQHPLGVVSGGDVYCLPNNSLASFAPCQFNDLMNSDSFDTNATTEIVPMGYNVGQTTQFEGTLGLSFEMPKNDTNLPAGPIQEYAVGYSPKDISISALNMNYLARTSPDGTTATNGTMEGKFHLILEGYLINS